MNWSIRPGRDDDSWELIALIGACWGEYPGCVMDVHGECPDLLAPARTYGDAGGRLWVATDPGGVVVASVATRPRPDAAIDRERLYVAPRARRPGLARRLVELVESHGRQAGASRVELWSDTRFTSAHALYRRLGYQPTGQVREQHDRSDTVEHHFVRPLLQG
ncbi:MAG: GNAT family N-acetyltransferase [Acidimicrobiales bacterium]